MLPLPPLLVVPQLQPLLSCPSFSSSFSLESPLLLHLLQNMQKEHLEHHKLFMDASPEDFFLFPFHPPSVTGSFLGFLDLTTGVSGSSAASSSSTSSNFLFFEVEGIVESPDGS